ncbi:MAG: hypothetical protein IBX43_03570 [Campylobacterales bacterium]|nr:hypothetical protein [Campylobacterales bacterium]
MKKINLFNEIIITSNTELSQALSSNKTFGITLKGEIKYAPFEPSDIFIYQGKVAPQSASALSLPKSQSKQELLGKNYQVLEDDDRVLIKAGGAWQDIINYNVRNCHYDDTTGDGVAQFGDEELEEMGWKVTDFDVSYRVLVEHLEEKADVTLVCIESLEPSYQFSGMGYFNDMALARKVMFEYCQETIKEKISNNPDYAKETLDDEQLETAEFFNVL